MNNLTPEQLAQLQALTTGGNSGYTPYGTMSQDGMTYSPMVSYGQGMDGVGNNSVEGYYSYDPNHMKVGDPFQAYNKDGTDGGMRKFQALPVSDFLIPFGAALAMGAFLPGMMGGAGAGAGGGLGAAVDPMMYGGTGASTWGAGEAAAAGAGGAGAAGGGYTTVPDLLPTMTYPSSSAASLLDGIAPIGSAAGAASTFSKIGKVLAPIAGAALGSQPQEKTMTQAHDIPEWLKPYVIGDSSHTGLLNVANSMLDRSFSPDQMTQNDWMRQHAVGLLMPQQQANFSKFFPSAGQRQAVGLLGPGASPQGAMPPQMGMLQRPGFFGS